METSQVTHCCPHERPRYGYGWFTALHNGLSTSDYSAKL
jgi:hypothetical protein